MTNSQGSQCPYGVPEDSMQGDWKHSNDLVTSLAASLTSARFARYQEACNGDPLLAVALYEWNARLSQSLYIAIQAWEVTLRNKLDGFLRWKYNSGWPYDLQRARRNFQGHDRRRLEETIQREEKRRGYKPVSTDAIVADLSAGFWVSLLSSSYDIPFTWRHNIRRILPHNAIERSEAYDICSRLLTLRNRIAHHEPIYHLDLDRDHADLLKLTAGMCPGALHLVNWNCSYKRVKHEGPQKITPSSTPE